MRRLLTVFLIALLTGLMVGLPLKLVLGLTGNGLDLSRAEIHGSVWNGTIRGARIGQVSLRRAQIRARPWALLGGRLAADWELAEGGLRGRGRAQIDLHGDWQVLDARFDIVPSRLGLREIPGLTDAAIFTIDLQLLESAEGQCTLASGAMRADLSADLSREFGLALPELSGPLMCRDGRLMAALAGQSQDMTVATEISFDLAGIAWTAGITTENSDLGNALAYSGFNLEGGVWRRDGEMDHAE